MVWWGKTVALALLAGMLIAAAVVGWRLSGLPYLDTPDKFFYDLRYLIFAHKEPSARKEFAIVSISDRSLDGYPSLKPVDRRLLARLVDELLASDVRAIGLAFQFDRRGADAADQALQTAIASGGGKVAVGVIDGRSGESGDRLAFQNEFLAAIPEAKRGHLYFDGQRRGLGQQPDLAVRFIARRSGAADERPESLVEAVFEAAGETVEDIGQTRIVPEGKPGPHIAWTQPIADNGARTFTLIEIPSHGGPQSTKPLLSEAQREVLRDRIVIVGADIESNDRHLTPFSVGGGERMSNAEIHTQIAAQLKDGRRVTTLSLQYETVLAFAIGALAFLIGYARAVRRERPYVVAGNMDYFKVGIPLALFGAAAFALSSTILPSDTMLYSALGGVMAGHFGHNNLSGSGAIFADTPENTASP